MQAYVAVQKKMLTIIYTLWKTDKPFDAAYNKTKEPFQNTESEVIDLKHTETISSPIQVRQPGVEKKVVQELARTTQGRYSKKELWDIAFNGFENTSKNPI